jgi:hypothetical protein
VEQQLEKTRTILARCEGYLREREEFKHLEALVARLQGYIMMNRQGASGFTEEEKMVVRELFGVRPGSGNPEELRRRLVSEVESHRNTLMLLRNVDGENS